MSIFSRLKYLFRRRSVKVYKKSYDYNGRGLSVEIKEAVGFSEEEFATLQRAIKILIEVVNSKEFQRYCINPPRNLDHTNGLSSSEIYELFMSGKTALDPTEDTDIDIYINIYYAPNRTIGYTYPNTLKTWINRRYYSDSTVATIISNLIHEYLHKCGFKHEMTGYSQYNIPYYYGNGAHYFAKQILNGHVLTPLEAARGVE